MKRPTLSLVAHMVGVPAVAAAVFALVASPAQPAFAHDGVDHKAEKKIEESLKSLPEADQKLAQAQRFCPMMPRNRLGAMGAPVKVMVAGKPVFVCCKGCAKQAVKNGEKTLRAQKKLIASTQTLAKLPTKERAAVEAQKFCAVANTSLLGSMGAPIKLVFDGKPVYLCCEGCEAKAKADPAATLAKVEKLTSAGKKKESDHGDHDHDHAK